MYGFIYKSGGDYALRMGEKLYFLFDGISDIQEEVEIGNINTKDKIDGYCLRFGRGMWKIIDTGHKCCKDILASGKYGEGFEESMKPLLKVFNK